MSVSAAMREISIHAPAKGATARRRMMCRCVSNFNPRSREGSDAPCSSDRQSAFLFQSTLPRRERRRASCPSPRRSRYFNPRSREGSDAAGLHTAAPVRHFNPRSREGSDVPQDLHLLSALCISIHAPAKGATSVQRSYGQGCGISIHAPAKGATASVAHTHRRRDDFNPRSREGSDHTTVLDS